MKKWKAIAVLVLSISFSSCSLFMPKDIIPNFSNPGRWRVFRTVNSRGLDDITTFSANGIVTDYLDHVATNGEIVAVGSHLEGLSYLRLSDLGDPRGKVRSYTGLANGDAIDKFGFSGFAVRPSDNKMFAWYARNIIDVEGLSPVSNLAPDMTNGYRGVFPKNRFEIDSDGRFWMGATEMAFQTDLPDTQPLQNGLYVISADLTTRQQILDTPIWHIGKDQNGKIIVSAYDGLYRIEGINATKIYTPPAGHFVEQAFAFSGALYFFEKNFYHNEANIPPGEAHTKFRLLKLNDDQTTVQVGQTLIDRRESARFIYNGNLFVFAGQFSKMEGNDLVRDSAFESIASSMGIFNFAVSGNRVFSVGNHAGLSVHDGVNVMNLTTATTAEALIADYISTIFSASNGNVYVGPNHSDGFSVYENGVFKSYSFPGQVNISGFFDHDGSTYVQGAVNLAKIKPDNTLEILKNFSTNGERITHDPSGYVWAYPNWGLGLGVIGKMKLSSPYPITRTAHPEGGDYWSGNDPSGTPTWTFDRKYHFNNVAPIPGRNEVMIGVSSGMVRESIPYTLRYSHASDSFTKIPIPDNSSEGMLTMAHDGETLYGVARQKLYRYSGDNWAYHCPLILGNDIRDMVVVGPYAIIASGWNSDGPGMHGGIEVVNLETKESRRYTSADIPLPSDPVFALELQEMPDSTYRLWIGTFKGVAYCSLDI